MSVFTGRVFWATGLLLGLLCSAAANAQQTGVPERSSPEPPSIGPQIPRATAAIAEPVLVAASGGACAQLPDDPGAGRTQQPTDVANANASSNGSAKPDDNDDSTATGKQTKRILYMVPNFRSVSADEKLPRQSVKDKLKTATEDSLDYSSFIFYGFQSGVGWMSNSYPEFRTGIPAYGRYYWHTLADSTSENYWVEFLIPSALHQDTRYYTLGKGSFAKRFVYSFTRTMLTRTDGGGQTLNVSEIVGAGAAAGMSNLYYPSPERTFTKTYQRWVTNFVIDGGTFVFKEFWPDLNNTFFHEQD